MPFIILFRMNVSDPVRPGGDERERRGRGDERERRRGS